MNTIDAYTAGYIDGDGCFYIGKTTNKKTGKTKYQSMLVISSTNSVVLKFFVSVYGGSVFLSNKNSKIVGHKPQYQFSIKDKKALNIAEKIFPHIVEKSFQCQVFCAFINALTTHTKEWEIKNMQMVKGLYCVNDTHKDFISNLRNTEIPCEFDYAYLAGFIDAECCLSIQHYKPKNKPNDCFKIILSCNNTKYPTIKYLIERFGGQVHFIERKSKNINHKDQLTWRLSGKALFEVLPKIIPYLKYKQPVCEKLIEFYKLTIKNGGDRQSEAFKLAYNSILESKMEIVRQVHILNKKGI